MARLPLLVGGVAAIVAFGAVMLLSDGVGARKELVAERASSGLAVFNRVGCGSCHRLAAARSSGRIGPNLDERLESHTADSLRAQIVAPRRTGMMPPDIGERMTKAEVDALVGFLLAAQR
jgi:mono/diheme cytochrome c family protein